MKLRALTVNNLRRFTQPTAMAGLSDGLNVLTEPNERGKSTLFDALQALFFKPHGSRDKQVKALQPHAGGGPEATAEIETPQGRFEISKRWLSRPMAEVRQDGRLIAQSDAAEDWLRAQMGADGAGPSGLIWVRQGLTGLDMPTGRERDDARKARRDLMSSVGAEVEAVTGGRRMDAALARCRAELEVHVTSAGLKPDAATVTARRGGPWKAAQEDVARLEAEVGDLTGHVAALHDALAARRSARKKLADLEDPAAMAERKTRVDAAREALAEARTHAERVAAQTLRSSTARTALEQAEGRLTRFAAAKTELAEAHTARAVAQDHKATKAKTVEQADQARQDAENGLQAAREAHAAARAALSAAEARQRAHDSAERRADLTQKLQAAKQAQADANRHRAAAEQGPDTAQITALRRLAATLDVARAAHAATLPQVSVKYVPGRSDGFDLDGTTLTDGAPLPVDRPMTIGVSGLGWLHLRPGEGATADGVASAEADLTTALTGCGVASLEAAETAAAARSEAQRQVTRAQEALALLAPEGIDALDAALARLPAPPEDEGAEDAPDPDAAREGAEAAQIALDRAEQARDRAREQHSQAREAHTEADFADRSAATRLIQAEAAMVAFEQATHDTLTAARDQARNALAAAQADLDRMQEGAPDVEAARAALTRWETVQSGANEAMNSLRQSLAQLEERITQGAGEAVEERLAEATQQLNTARATLAGLDHEVAVLRRLLVALDAARSEARERYFAPVMQELGPLLALLWPDAELIWADDTLLPEALVREGVSEPIDVLSGGTQEQLALLVRLAFARMLAKAGRPVPVILDDALVFTDDDRIDRLFTALHGQAQDLQILVLTCRQRAFRDLGGHVLHLETQEAPA